MSNPKMREIGRLLKEEESRFVGFPEIETKSKELGFGMTVRTLRFYIDEGILPPPKKVGKTPVYEEDWILNVLLSIHLMKSRLNRSLSEVRIVLARLQEDPSILADKLSVLYEDYVKAGPLKPVERDWLVEAFFGLLTGKFATPVRADNAGAGQPRPRKASEIRLSDLTRAIAELGHWKSPDAWEPPDPQKVGLLVSEADDQRSQGMAAAPGLTGAPGRVAGAVAASATASVTGAVSSTTAPQAPTSPVVTTVIATPASTPSIPAVQALVKAAEVEARQQPPLEIRPVPKDAIALDKARALEEMFVRRFEAAFEARSHVPSPLDGAVLKCGPKERSHLQRDHSSKVIELMKRNRVYDRGLLDLIPLDEASEYHVYHRSFLGKGELKVVVAALAVSPLEEFVIKRHAQAPLGMADVERALSELVVQDDIFYYVGLFSTTGWSADARAAGPVRRNLLACLVEQAREVRPATSPWARSFALDVRWGGLERLFDPETDREKVERVRTYLAETPELKLRGGHVTLKNVREDLLVTEDALRAAVAELCATDQDLSIVEVGGREILKRRRI